MTRVLACLFLLISLSANAQDILLDVSAPVKDNKKILIATFYRNEPNFYYFTIVYKFRGILPINYKTKISFTLEEASRTHYRLENWIVRIAKGPNRIVADRISVCPIDPSQLPTDVDVDRLIFERDFR